jgi:hypothetical protein
MSELPFFVCKALSRDDELLLSLIIGLDELSILSLCQDEKRKLSFLTVGQAPQVSFFAEELGLDDEEAIQKLFLAGRGKSQLTSFGGK